MKPYSDAANDVEREESVWLVPFCMLIQTEKLCKALRNTIDSNIIFRYPEKG